MGGRDGTALAKHCKDSHFVVKRPHMNKAMNYGFALTLGSSMCWAADKVTAVPVSFAKGANSARSGD
jgi:hypothetical protein